MSEATPSEQPVEVTQADREAADFRLADQINDLYLHGGLAMHRTSRLHALAQIIATAHAAERTEHAKVKTERDEWHKEWSECVDLLAVKRKRITELEDTVKRLREAGESLLPLAEMAMDVDSVGGAGDPCGVNRGQAVIELARSYLSEKKLPGMKCPDCGADLVLSSGWVPSFNDPDNAGGAKAAEPICEKCNVEAPP